MAVPGPGCWRFRHGSTLPPPDGESLALGDGAATLVSRPPGCRRSNSEHAVLPEHDFRELTRHRVLASPSVEPAEERSPVRLAFHRLWRRRGGRCSRSGRDAGNRARTPSSPSRSRRRIVAGRRRSARRVDPDPARRQRVRAVDAAGRSCTWLGSLMTTTAAAAIERDRRWRCLRCCAWALVVNADRRRSQAIAP